MAKTMKAAAGQVGKELKKKALQRQLEAAKATHEKAENKTGKLRERLEKAEARLAKAAEDSGFATVPARTVSCAGRTGAGCARQTGRAHREDGEVRESGCCRQSRSRRQVRARDQGAHDENRGPSQLERQVKRP